MDNRIIKIAEEYGHRPQLQMLIEEMAELTKAICKFIRVDDRAKREPVQVAECTEVIENIIEEMADVQIMILQLQHFINLSDESFKEQMNKKLDRQIERINLKKDRPLTQNELEKMFEAKGM